MKKKAPQFSASEWREIYEALMDAAEKEHSGPRADRLVDLAGKIWKAL